MVGGGRWGNSKVSEEKPKFHTLRIYMKSGNVVTLPRVLSWEYIDNSFKRSLVLEQFAERGFERLLTRTLDVMQIEAITVEAQQE